MKNCIFQKFLLNCDYESVHLEQISEYRDSMNFVMPYGTEYCLFDLNQRVIRKLPLNELDTMIDTEEDWNLFVESLNGIDQLVIERQKTICGIVKTWRKLKWTISESRKIISTRNTSAVLCQENRVLLRRNG